MYDFFKYQGTGNDFILFDERNQNLKSQQILTNQDFIKFFSKRRYGIGCDGIIICCPPEEGGLVRMRIYNSDGTEAEMCGNGIRCLVKYLYDRKEIIFNETLIIETLAGFIEANVDNKQKIKVNMGTPSIDPNSIPTYYTVGSSGIPQKTLKLNGNNHISVAVGMGNPHLIVFVDDLNSINLHKSGKELEHSVDFPKKTNVHFVKIINDKKIEILVWERGVGATLACGTGACACLVASHLLGYTNSQALISLPGGNLFINWPNRLSNIYMTGQANQVYKGIIPEEIISDLVLQSD